jgi:Na+/melibiose symporter-like transporter
MKDRNAPILVTVASAIVCACPGLFIGITGFVAALGAQEFDLGFFTAILFVCPGFALVLIPIGVGFYTLSPPRKKKVEEGLAPDEPIPPAI